MFGNSKQVIQDYDTVFDNSILFRKNDLLQITYTRAGLIFRVEDNSFPWPPPGLLDSLALVRV